MPTAISSTSAETPLAARGADKDQDQHADGEYGLREEVKTEFCEE